jgi:adenylate kinase
MRQSNVGLDFVLEIDVDHGEIIRRLSGRRVHPASGRNYHLTLNPPKASGKDDLTGEPLVQREDDTEQTVRRRLEVYEKQTRPLVDYYSKWAAQGDPRAPRYRKISGKGSVEEIGARVLAALK